MPLTVTSVSQDENSVTAAGITARYLVAADGLHSPISRTLGLDRPIRGDRHRWGLRRHFAVEPWTDFVEVHWSDRSEAYLTPVGPALVGVAVLSSDRGSFEEQLAAFPDLASRLTGSEAGTVRGAGPLRRRTIRRADGRVLLVGDAAGYVDALTGEGIAVSLACARSLVDCVVQGDPAGYERCWAGHPAVSIHHLGPALGQPPLAPAPGDRAGGSAVAAGVRCRGRSAGSLIRLRTGNVPALVQRHRRQILIRLAERERAELALRFGGESVRVQRQPDQHDDAQHQRHPVQHAVNHRADQDRRHPPGRFRSAVRQISPTGGRNPPTRVFDPPTRTQNSVS